jgi:hypothetical protein
MRIGAVLGLVLEALKPNQLEHTQRSASYFWPLYNF